jgi:hypothetical protein
MLSSDDKETESVAGKTGHDIMWRMNQLSLSLRLLAIHKLQCSNIHKLVYPTTLRSQGARQHRWYSMWFVHIQFLSALTFEHGPFKSECQ